MSFFDMKISVLADLGGRDIAETCRRVMDFMMTNELAACYTISGKGHDKKPFGNTLIFETVFRKYMLQDNILL